VTGMPATELEPGLPAKQGEFAISLPWVVRFVLTAAIGAAIGFAASTVLGSRVAALSSGWLMIVAGGLAATLLSIRKVHGWHVSTFADGTIVGLAAGPIFVVLTFVRAALQPENHLTWAAVEGGLMLFLGVSIVGVLATVPCGWLAGFAYHVLLSAAERTRTKDEDMAA
jgi:hypothetical protein